MRPILKNMSKAKAAKVVRKLVELYLDMDQTTNELAVKLCEECIQWAKEEKRTFLRFELGIDFIFHLRQFL